MIKASSLFKKIGNGIFATSYYTITIIISIILTMSLFIFCGLKIYSNVLNQYKNTQIAWHNVTNDISNDLSEMKIQVSKLNTLIDTSSEDGSVQEYELVKVSKIIDEMDNAMTYAEQYEKYQDLTVCINKINTLTNSIDTNHETQFDSSKILSNNKELLNEYNNTINKTNKKLKSPFGKLIQNIFNLHYWNTIDLKY